MKTFLSVLAALWVWDTIKLLARLIVARWND